MSCWRRPTRSACLHMACTSDWAPRDAAEVYRTIHDITARLQGLGWPSFVNSGTLLGLVREGRLLAHDDDIDLAVVLPVSSVLEVKAQRQAFTRMMSETGLAVSERQAHWKVMRLGVPFDLFPAWSDVQGRLHIYPYCPGAVRTADMLPTVATTFEGVPLSMPRQAEQLLEVNYGPGWKQPDPTFHFDWKSARRAFKDLVLP